MPSIAEIDMTSSGSGYERHLVNSLTIIGKTKKQSKTKSKATHIKNVKPSVHHDMEA